MELEFFLPFVDELKRLDRANDKKKISGHAALDRFYSSDLFDRNVLLIVKEFTEIKYDVQIFNAEHKMITAVEYDFAGKFEIEPFPGDAWITVRIKDAGGCVEMSHLQILFRVLLCSGKGIRSIRRNHTRYICEKFLKMLLQ